VEGYVCNKSSQTFNKQELDFLNLGLNYVPPPTRKICINDTIAEIECAIKYNSFAEKENIRKSLIPVLKDVKNNQKQDVKKHRNLIPELKTKDVFYMKADKGNKMVIVDRTTYEEDVLKIVTGDGFIQVKCTNPLAKMIKDAKNSVKCSKEILGIPPQKLIDSNPEVPRIYALYKTHKSGMRPIIANVRSPTSKIAKYLVKELSKLPPPKGFYIKNSLELADQISGMKIAENEILVSFDVTALYPSVPIPVALELLTEWLCEQDISDEKTVMLMDLIKLCMEQTTFQFRDKFYRQCLGTSMGNSLSCFVANTFMAHLEWNMSRKSCFPRYWRRYVDDILVVVNKEKVEELLFELNSCYDSIKFTIEAEVNGKLPFLDLLLDRKNGIIEMSIYRKPTSTYRYIPYTSNTSYQHKMAAFNSMVYRLCRLPLNAKNFINELKTIKTIATINGYKEQTIDELVGRHSRNIKLRSITTLTKETTSTFPLYRKKLSYIGPQSHSVSNILNKHEISCVWGNDNKLTRLLGNPKDKIPNMKKSGIYSITCKDCDEKYVGQSRRAIHSRFLEHRNHWRNGEEQKSSVAKHMIEKDHEFDSTSIELLKHLTNRIQLDAYESIFINKIRPTMNADKGPIESKLFQLLD
jgi:hypothetical protein